MFANVGPHFIQSVWRGCVKQNFLDYCVVVFSWKEKHVFIPHIKLSKKVLYWYQDSAIVSVPMRKVWKLLRINAAISLLTFWFQSTHRTHHMWNLLCFPYKIFIYVKKYPSVNMTTPMLQPPVYYLYAYMSMHFL